MVTALGAKKTNMMGYRAEKEVCRYLQLFGLDTMHDERDGRTDTGRLQRPRLR